MMVYVALYPKHKMLKRVLCSLAFLLLTNASISFAQQAPQPAADQAELNELIRRAAIRMNEYKTGFKDLTAEEEQKIEEYDDKGKRQKQRRIDPNLLTYQRKLDQTKIIEYGALKWVAGKAVKSEKRGW